MTKEDNSRNDPLKQYVNEEVQKKVKRHPSPYDDIIIWTGGLPFRIQPPSPPTLIAIGIAVVTVAANFSDLCNNLIQIYAWLRGLL